MTFEITIQKNQLPRCRVTVPTPELVDIAMNSPDTAMRVAALEEISKLPPDEKVLCQELILRDFLDFVEEESEKGDYPDTFSQCVGYLQDCLKGNLTVDPEDAIKGRPESFQDMVHAVALASFVGAEEVPEALDVNWIECVDATLKCGHCNAALTGFLTLTLVSRLLSECLLLGGKLTLPLARGLRVYFQLALGAIPSALSMAWATDNNP